LLGTNADKRLVTNTQRVAAVLPLSVTTLDITVFAQVKNSAGESKSTGRIFYVPSKGKGYGQ